jgi:3-hydroxymyristoyl/3-hydroxydecanoyl-(acyl carrier protein) dehydratase
MEHTITVEDILPHRSPFLFVDRVKAVELGKRIVAEKDLSPEACFFAGHFPGEPIMPGVLVSEALAQTSGLLLGLTQQKEGRGPDDGIPYFLANVNMKFSSPARPGETLRLESVLKKAYGHVYLFDVSAYVMTTPIAKGTLTLARQKVPENQLL